MARSGPPLRRFLNWQAKFAATPMILTALVVFIGCSLWTVVHSFTNSRLPPRLDFVGLAQYERLWSTPRWLVSIENLAMYGVCALTLVIGFLLAVLLDQKIRFEDGFRTIILFPYALSFIVTGVVCQWILNPDFGLQHIVRSAGFSGFSFDPLNDPSLVILALLAAGIWQGAGLTKVIVLAGLRGIDEDVWKARRVDGIPAWKTYLFIVLQMMKPVFATCIVLISARIIKLYDLVVALTRRGPGIASEVPAKYVYDYMFGNQNLGQGFAASTMMLAAVLAIIIPFALFRLGRKRHVGRRLLRCRSGRTPQHRSARPLLDGPASLAPARRLSGKRIMIYGGLLVFSAYYLLPLWVMVMTSLKGMPEIRIGNIFAPAVEITFEPWVKAWSSACTGLNCGGLSRGFWNSVAIVVPATILSIAVAAVNGYALVNWRFKGSEVFFTILIFGAFIPYQVMICPIVIILREIRLMGSVWGLVLVHVVFGMPIITLLFRNCFSSLPPELFKAARVDGGGFWGIFLRVLVPMSLPILTVAVILQVTGIWNDFLFGVIYTRPESHPMTVQLNNIVNSVQGVREYNVNMAATLLTGLVPLTIYFLSGKLFVRGIAAGAVKG